jgi:hypothetical protein
MINNKHISVGQKSIIVFYPGLSDVNFKNILDLRKNLDLPPAKFTELVDMLLSVGVFAKTEKGTIMVDLRNDNSGIIWTLDKSYLPTDKSKKILLKFLDIEDRKGTLSSFVEKNPSKAIQFISQIRNASDRNLYIGQIASAIGPRLSAPMTLSIQKVLSELLPNYNNLRLFFEYAFIGYSHENQVQTGTIDEVSPPDLISKLATEIESNFPQDKYLLKKALLFGSYASDFYYSGDEEAWEASAEIIYGLGWSSEVPFYERNEQPEKTLFQELSSTFIQAVTREYQLPQFLRLSSQ